jgi:hypothetical protein
MLLVYDVGAQSASPLRAAVEAVIQDRPHVIYTLSREDTPGLTYRRTAEDLRQSFASMETKALTSMRIEPQGEGIQLVMVYSPGFQEDGPPWWNATIDYRAEEYETLFHRLCAVPGTDYVAVSREEGLDLGSGMNSCLKFPWADPRLVVASVRDDSGRWVAKEGLAHTGSTS